MTWLMRPIPKATPIPSHQTVRAYRVVVHWHDGRKTCEAQSDNPSALKGAPMIARNARSIARIEIHDRTGVLETVWASHWVGYQNADREPIE